MSVDQDQVDAISSQQTLGYWLQKLNEGKYLILIFSLIFLVGAVFLDYLLETFQLTGQDPSIQVISL